MTREQFLEGAFKTYDPKYGDFFTYLSILERWLKGEININVKQQEQVKQEETTNG